MFRGRADERLARRGGAIELLRVPSALFAGVVSSRNALYDRGLLPVERLETPVASVGNITAGGTGKTPFVALLARELPGVPLVEDRDRVAGGRRLEVQGVDAIVLDDGFQHRRLARELDIVLIDATRPFGLPAPPSGGAPVQSLLPRGLLREPLRSLARAHALVLTRCDQVGASELDLLEATLREHAPGVPLLHAAHRPSSLRSPDGALSLEVLRDHPVQLVSGIGNPSAFERSARELGARVLAAHHFPDHHDFRAEELAPILAVGGELLVTAKDAVKIEELGVPCLVLEVELAILRGAAVLAALLDALPTSRGGEDRAALHAGLAG